MSSDTSTTNGMSRREELLAVAKLFAARGYHGTRMDDVADEVGLNKATVYHYYASKSLILYDIYKQAADSTVAALHDDPYRVGARDHLPLHPPAAGRHRERPRAGGGVLPGRAVHHRVVHRGSGRLHPDAETQVYEHVRDVIDRGIASGEFYDCDSHVLALGYIGMTLGSYRWLRPQGRRTAQEIAVEFSTALLRGLIRDEAVGRNRRWASTLGRYPANSNRKR